MRKPGRPRKEDEGAMTVVVDEGIEKEVATMTGVVRELLIPGIKNMIQTDLESLARYKEFTEKVDFLAKEVDRLWSELNSIKSGATADILRKLFLEK